MSTTEFDHYDGCGLNDPDNCPGCALTTGDEDGPNYTAWPLAYIRNKRVVPAKWRNAFKRELQSQNRAYAENIKRQIEVYGIRFSDGKGIE